jgi:serine/threonine protein phosphatase PrpC
MSRIQHSIASYGISDTGLQRANNQDNFIVADLTRNVIGRHENRVSPGLLYHEIGSHGTLLAVADGLGGYAGGEVASQIAVEVSAQTLLGLVEKQLSPAEKLSRAIEEAQQAICKQRQHEDCRAHMASTITALHVDRGTMTVAQVGDSRAYLFRDGRLTLLTEDQTLVNMLLKRGLLTEEEASRHPDRHVILQALGQDNAVLPEVHDLPFQHNDCVLLCTDGLSSYVSHEHIETILAAQEDGSVRCRRLIDAANAAGGMDNVTVLVARLMVRTASVSG